MREPLPLSNARGDGGEPVRVPDGSHPLVLVGFIDYHNLGLGYLAAVLERAGYRVLVLSIEEDPDALLQEIQAAQPLLVGFSLIFQYHVLRFREVADVLRRGGIDCHFTMGGHFPSLSWEHALRLVPALDSVVRFEGEFTLLELADRLAAGADWRQVPGIAHRDNGASVSNPLRPLVRDLDSLPYPRRDAEPFMMLGHRALPILASRGCARTCAFCSIHRFYRSAPGKTVRTRAPRAVVEEMRLLHEQHGINIFLFQDDDFPLVGPVWRRWVAAFLEELHRAELPGRAIWKISCRADALDRELFTELRDAGLYLVYVGLESGTDRGLRTLAKGLGVEQNLRAVAIVKELGLLLQYGFMMFDPGSTFESIRANVGFLRQVVGDGRAAAIFCRMVPYDGTPIKAELEAAGRLTGDVLDPGYDFLDPRLDRLFDEVNRLVHVSGWIYGSESLTAHINWAWNELAVLDRLFPPLAGRDEYEPALRAITGACNATLLDLVERLADRHEHGRPAECDADELCAQAGAFAGRLARTRDDFILRNQATILEALAPAPD